MIVRRTILAVSLALVVASCEGDGAAETSTSAPQPAASTSAAAPATTAAPALTSTTATATTMTTPEATTTPSVEGVVIEVTIADGEVTGPARPSVAVGETVTIVVTSDVADELHVHGYDLFVTLAPGTPAELEFTADIPGIFEVELEGSHQLVFDLEVS